MTNNTDTSLSEKSFVFSISLIRYYVVLFFIFLLTTSLFLLKIPHKETASVLLISSAIIIYPLLYLLPSILISSFLTFFTAQWQKTHPALRNFLIRLGIFLTIFPVHLLLLLDAGLYYRYHYHINPHVINIFTTPGGFAGMGLRNSEIITIAFGILLLALIHIALIFFLVRPKQTKSTDIRKQIIHFSITSAVAGLLFLFTFLIYTFEHFSMNPEPLQAADAIPLFVKGTSEDFYLFLGFKQPNRDATRIKLANHVHIQNYPAKPIVRTDHIKYNVVWLACESWAAKLFQPRIMPETAKFAEKGVVFTHHYSGGNVTRQGMFSMFYGLPANYWHPFLAARRGPLFIDWLKEDGYQFKCITSSKFTYPEFDQTIFYQIPSEYLYSDDVGKTYMRDQRNVNVLLNAIQEGTESGKPFFTFMFFESPHNPYEFPPEAKVFDDYMDPFNAATVKTSDGPAIFRRAANCARHLDICLGKVFNLLQEKNLLENTIVIVAGDHGEEFLEHGYLGHSSQFNDEQTRTTLILYYPGITPGVYTSMSSHIDLIPMLAPLFGVQNPEQDYSCGFNLLASDKPLRHYCLIAGWDQVFFTGTKYKSLLPLKAIDYAKQVITDEKDNPLPSADPFYKEYNADLIQVQKDLTRFTAQSQAKGQSNLAVFIVIIICVFAVGAGFFRYIRNKKNPRENAQ